LPLGSTFVQSTEKKKGREKALARADGHEGRGKIFPLTVVLPPRWGKKGGKKGGSDHSFSPPRKEEKGKGRRQNSFVGTPSRGGKKRVRLACTTPLGGPGREERPPSTEETSFFGGKKEGPSRECSLGRKRGKRGREGKKKGGKTPRPAQRPLWWKRKDGPLLVGMNADGKKGKKKRGNTCRQRLNLCCRGGGEKRGGKFLPIKACDRSEEKSSC